MPRFKSKEIITAYRWFQNGDHPDDGSIMIEPKKDNVDQFKSFLSEGKVVRRYRIPGIEFHICEQYPVCEQCNKRMNVHGWIEDEICNKSMGKSGWVVCPGDYIITMDNGKYVVRSKDYMDKHYIDIDTLRDLKEIENF